MAALAVAGAVMAGCSGSDDIIDNPQPPTQKDNVVTVTTTISLAAGGGEEGGATTRALNPATGAKTFAVGDRISVDYKNTSNLSATAVSEPITDISADGKTATFTVTLTNPKEGESTVWYFYPVGADQANYNSAQDGSLETLQSTFDYSYGSGKMTVSGSTVTMPANVTLENQRAILAITFKDADGSIITGSFSEVVINFSNAYGNDTYTVRPKGNTFSQDVIYVAIDPAGKYEVDVTVTAKDVFYDYTKTLAEKKTYTINNFYNVGWRMEESTEREGVTQCNLAEATGNITLQNGQKVTGRLSGDYKVSIADGATVMLDGVTILGSGDEQYQWAGITCEGDATIILKGGTTNTVKGFYEDYPDIYVPQGKTLTIKGTGTLNASSNGHAAGIGGGSYIACGNIDIKGGTITATGGPTAAGIGSGGDSSCGNITISGGTITAVGDWGAAGIGSGCHNASCGNITITSGVTSVTATKGSDATHSIGTGYYGSCGTVTIGGTVYWENNDYVGDGETYLSQSPLVYQPQH